LFVYVRVFGGLDAKLILFSKMKLELKTSKQQNSYNVQPGWPDGYFSGHFWQMWLFLGAVYYKKIFWLYFGLVAILWLFFNLLKNKNF